MEILELDGINYEGRFEGEKLEGTDTARSCEAPDNEYKYTTYRYEGSGLIRSKESFPYYGDSLFRFVTSETGNYRLGLGDHLFSLVGRTSSSNLSLHDTKGKELLMFVIYQHLKKLKQEDRKRITPQIIGLRDITQTDFENARVRIEEAFSYSR